MGRYSAVLLVAVIVFGVAIAKAQKSGALGLEARIPELLSGQFNVSVDQFRPQNSEQTTFNYDYDIGHFKVGGPLFFYINDGEKYTTEWIQSGLMYDVARESGGALFTSALRFFRLNLPTETVALDDLALLTVEQSLADLVDLVQAAREHLHTNSSSKVYVWGSGWGGTLAVLARQKYPNLVDGAWSSSGIFEPTVFTTHNYDILPRLVFEYGGDACGLSFQSAFQTLEHVLMHRDEGRIVREFGLCRPWNASDPMDVGILAEALLDQIGDYLNVKHNAGLVSLCEALDVMPADPFASLARWVRFTYEADFGHCFNYDYAGRLKWLSDEQFHNPGTATGKRQFLYLQCMQLGQLRISQADGILGHHVTAEYRRRLCEEAFGDEYDFNQLAVNVARFQTHYGGKNPRATRVIFTNGMLDTWLSRGITEYSADESVVINIPGYGKSGDLSSANVHDSTVMYRTKTSIRRIIRNWVQGVPNE